MQGVVEVAGWVEGESMVALQGEVAGWVEGGSVVVL